MQKWIVISLIAWVSILQAYSQKRLSREEFIAKKHAYIAQRACLTEKESAQFFPLYSEMRRKINALNWSIAHNEREMGKGKHTEAEYDQVMNRINDSRIEAAKVEKTYYEKYKKILSSEKIYKIHMAEIEFHRSILKGKVR